MHHSKKLLGHQAADDLRSRDRIVTHGVHCQEEIPS
jgi:hypothetical protein